MRALLTDQWFDGDEFRDETVRLHLGGEGRLVRIEALRPGAPARARDDDARGRLVVPGLVNTHCHAARAGYFEPEEPPLQIPQTLLNLRRCLEAGVTTAADMGCTLPLLDALRELTRKDPQAGPRLVGAGPILTAPGGYPFNWVSDLWRWAEAAVPFDDETAAVRVAADLAKRGVDHYKVAIMNQSFLEEPMPAVSSRVARALVGEAHRLGKRVFVHAHSNLDYETALDAGVDGLMHSTYEPLTPELLLRVKDAGIPVCPTLWVYESSCYYREHKHFETERFTRHATPGLLKSWRRFAEALEASPEVFPKGTVPAGVSIERAKELMRIGSANLRLLHDAGVPIVFGNDASFGLSLLGRPVDELEAMQRAGLDARACLRSATRAAADLLGRAELGRIAPGAIADLVVVDARVRKDISAIEAPHRVYLAGQPLDEGAGLGRVARTAGAYLEGTLRTVVSATSRAVRERFLSAR
jgi:imidazolonepropionase-like amidohydrolase